MVWEDIQSIPKTMDFFVQVQLMYSTKIWRLSTLQSQLMYSWCTGRLMYSTQDWKIRSSQNFNSVCIIFITLEITCEITNYRTLSVSVYTNPANINLFKVSNRNTRKRCETWSKLTIKHQNEIIDIILMFLLLTLNIFYTFF